MKKLFSTLFWGTLLIIAPNLVLAATPGLSGTNLFTPAPGDLSISYLEQLFGTVGNVLHGTSGQMLGQLFFVFNSGMVMLAGGLLIYTIVLSVINTAHDGEFMGKRMNSGWVIFRAITGIGVLVPKFTGYSLVQVFIMWIVVQGVGLADYAWSKVVTYIAEEGGVLYIAPFSAQDAATTLPAISSILQSQVCMYKLQAISQGQRGEAAQQLKLNPNNPLLQAEARQNTTVFRPVWDDNAGAVRFGTDNPTDTTFSGVCGSYDYGQLTNNGQPTNNAIAKTKKIALQQIILDTTPIAKKLAVSSSIPNPNGQKNSIQMQVEQALVYGAIDYHNIMLPTMENVNENEVKDNKASLLEAKDKGWIVAGGYYRDIADINNKTNKKVKEGNLTVNTTFPTYDQWTKDYGLSEDDANSLAAVIKQSGNFVGAQSQNGSPTGAYALIAQMSKGNKPATVFSEEDKNATIAMSAVSSGILIGAAVSTGPGAVIVGVATAAFNGLLGTWFHLMNAPGINTVADPIIMLQQLGTVMVNMATTIWLAGSAALLGITAATGAAPAVNPTALAIIAAMSYFSPIISAIILALFVNGIMLAVYIPLIPFLIFTFAAIGWLISVLEAMVAGPLVALGVTHPEGHDLLGKAEQALMLLMGVFLRPVVMIIGFVSAMILARVSLFIINSTFSHVTGAIGLVGQGTNIILAMGLIVVYTMIIMTVINLVFNAGVVKLWETIWMWVGFHQPSSAAEQALQEIKGGVHGAAQTFAQGANTASETTAKGMLKKAQADKEKDNIKN